MDTTPPPLAPDLQTSLRHLRRIVLGGAAALVLLAGAAGYAAPAHAAGPSPNTGAGGGKVSMQRHVNEYEGQHRLAGGDAPGPSAGNGGKVGEVPVITG
jgi:hypothetical protein